MMSLFEYAKPFRFFSMYFLLAEVGGGGGGVPYLKIVNFNPVTSVGIQNQGEKFAY